MGRKKELPTAHAENISCKKCQWREERRAIGSLMFNRGCFVEYCGKLIDGGAKASEAICVLILECPLKNESEPETRGRVLPA